MGSADHEKIDILLVDDREENLLALEATLACDQYNIIKANSGAEALRYLLTHTCAVILMDVQMPEMDGFETASFIKKNERSSEIPIIFVTAISKGEGFVQQGYKTGAVDYIFKPIDSEILKSKVSIFADLYRSKRKIQHQAMLIQENEQRERQRILAMLELKSLKREQILQQKYKDLVEGLQHAIIWLYDYRLKTFVFVSPSAEDILEISAEEWFSNKNFLDRQVFTDDKNSLLRAMKTVIHSGETQELKHRMLHKNGEIRWFKTSLRLVESLESDSKLLHGLSMDITEIEKSLQMRDEFISIASHELKTPLTSLKLQLQMTMRHLRHAVESDFSTKAGRMLTASIKQADRLTTLIEDLLDVSRIQFGKLAFNFEKVDLVELVKDLTERFSEEFQNAGCPVQSTIGSEDLVGWWNQSRIEQVVVNLFTNAIKYAPGKKIEIGLRRRGNHAELSVRDHGLGIPVEKQNQIFNRFERVTAARNISGLGLGLYIVKQIVEAHKGIISVESEEGQGSKFTVLLPLKISEAAPQEHPAPQSHSSA